MPGEFDLISWILAQQRASDFVQLPAGDDLAVLKWNTGDLLLVGNDQVLDGVHFDSKIHPPKLIGQKVMNRNLSDCAAMACLPAAAVATVALPKGISLDYAKDLYLGMKSAADVFGCEVVGGDTATWDGKLVMTVSILGRSAGIQPITRKGAKVGDLVCVTGPLGGSIAGRHMTFTPRIELARKLAKEIQITSMLDLSDGLSRDIRHICNQSHVGAHIDTDKLPIHPDVDKTHRHGWSPAEHALHDGEDYELLFTCPTAPADGAIPIGRITTKRDITWMVDGKIQLLEPRAWEHSF